MRSAIRIVIALVLVAGIAFLVLGYWAGSTLGPVRLSTPDQTTGTTGVDTQKARERGAELGEKAAVATEKVREAVGEASLTTKIKAKMALDDLVKARTIDVTTNDGIVTISGTVTSAAERDRALQLTRETEGVTRVIDQLRVDR